MSDIVSATIDENFPEEGKDNPSQGFRDNFSLIKNGLATAAAEITGLQNNTAKLTSNNNFNGNIISNARMQEVYPLTVIIADTPSPSGEINVEVKSGEYYRFTPGGNRTINFTGWPAGTLYVRIRLEIVSGTTNHVISFKSNNDSNLIRPIGDASTNSISTGTVAGNSTIVDFWTTNSGNPAYLALVGDADAGTAIATIEQIGNVTINSPTTGEVLKFDGTNWINGADNDTIVTSLASIPGTDIDSPLAGQVLKYDGTNWINGSASDTISINDLTNVSIESLTPGQVLKYNGTAWINDTDSDTLVTSLGSIPGVVINSPSNGQVLKFDGTSWVNGTDDLGDNLSLSDLNNVTITTPSTGQVLKFNGTSWVNGSDNDTLFYTGAEDIPPSAAIDLTKSVTHFTTVSSETSTLAAGTQGLIKTLIMIGFGGNMVVTVTNAGWGGTSTITFSGNGQACTLQYINNSWYCIGNNGCTFA